MVVCPEALAVSPNAFPDFTLRLERGHFPPADALGARICSLPSSLSAPLMGFGVPETRRLGVKGMVLLLSYVPRKWVECGGGPEKGVG